MEGDGETYEELHKKFVYLQQQTNRLGAAYTLATQELDALALDNKILKEKLLKIRLRRRELAAHAQANINANMSAKTLFCRRNRRVLRKQFPLVSRSQLSAYLNEEWDSLPKEVMEKWQRDFKAYVPKQKPTKARSEDKAAAQNDGTPVKKAPARSRKKPAAGTDENKPKPKRATPKKKADPATPAEKKPKKSPAKKKPPSKPVKEEKPPAPVDDDDDEPADDNSSGNSSMAPSDEDDSDDNLMHLPTGAFG